jgi:ElaB/YqjD/DUF883 family membrane-anchored ribosome-binding protein
MTSGTEADVKTLRDEMAQLRTDFAKIRDTLQNLVRHGTADAVGKAQQSAQRVQDEVKKIGQSVGQEIEKRPIAAALTAFSVGLILGMLFSGRRAQPAASSIAPPIR